MSGTGWGITLLVTALVIMAGVVAILWMQANVLAKRIDVLSTHLGHVDSSLESHDRQLAMFSQQIDTVATNLDDLEEEVAQTRKLVVR